MIDLFETRTMLSILDQRVPPRTFLRDTFFSNVVTSIAKHVDIDVIKHKRRLAPFVSPKMEGKVVGREGFKTYTYTPPYIKQKMTTDAADFFKRMPGETIYGPGDGPAQRAAAQLGRDLLTLEEMIVRREEWMAAQVLDTGAVTVTGDGIADTIDYLMSATHKITLTSTALWTDTTGVANPLNDLRVWKRLISKDSGLSPDIVIMGQDVLEPFLQNTYVKARLVNNFRGDFGTLAPKKLDQGVTWIATFPELGIEIYTYDEWYLDPTDGTTLTPMVPLNKIWMGARSARCTMHYGAIQDLEAMSPVARFPKSWQTTDPSARWVMLQSAPLPAMHQPDGFLTAQVI